MTASPDLQPTFRNLSSKTTSTNTHPEKNSLTMRTHSQPHLGDHSDDEPFREQSPPLHHPQSFPHEPPCSGLSVHSCNMPAATAATSAFHHGSTSFNNPSLINGQMNCRGHTLKSKRASWSTTTLGPSKASLHHLGHGNEITTINSGQNSPAQKRRRVNLLRVRIERGIVVGMALLAGYRMMVLDLSKEQLSSPSTASTVSWRDQVQQEIARNAWALGAGLVLLALVHALVLTAHDHLLQFPHHGKNMPLQPLRKRASWYLHSTPTPPHHASLPIATDSDDDTDENESDLRPEMTAVETMEGPTGMGHEPTAPASPGYRLLNPLLSGLQSRFSPPVEGAMPQWRVWGSEPNWYRKGADNGAIFTTIIVPVVLAAKFVQTVTDGNFLSKGMDGVKIAQAILSNMALSLTFGVSILVHMALHKAFDNPAPLNSGPRTGRPSSFYGGKDTPTRSTFLDSIALPPSLTSSTAPSTTNLCSAGGDLYPTKHFAHARHQQHLNQQNAISSPSSPSSPSLSGTSTPPSEVTLHADRQEKIHPTEFPEAFMFSAEPVHHPSLLLGTSEIEKVNDREEIWIIALGFGGAYTCLVTLLARFRCIPGLESTGAGMVMLNQNIFQLLMITMAYYLRRSFTFGELTILAQAVTLLINETLKMNFMAPGAESGQVHENPEFMFLLALVVGMLFIGTVLLPVLMYCRRLAQMPTKGASAANLQKREFKKKVAAGVVYSGLFAIVAGVIMPRCERVLGQNPFLWLIDFMLMSPGFVAKVWESLNSGSIAAETKNQTSAALLGLGSLDGVKIGWSRLGLCMYWILAVACSIGFFYWVNMGPSGPSPSGVSKSSLLRGRKSIMGSLNNRRKFYHALAVCMFIPGYLTDEPFMHLAFSVALAALIFIEYIRSFAVVPFGKAIHLFLIGFLDARDGGSIILSHLYLLMGCAAPVWLAEHHILAGLSGIFALGVGDAMASIVGKRFGRHRWPGTVKTVEGTVAFVVSVMMAAGSIFLGMYVMSFVFGDNGPPTVILDMIATKAGTTTGFGLEMASRTSPPAAEPSTFGPPASLLSFSTWNDWSAVSWSLWGIIRYGMAVSIAAMLEAVSEQNDNLVIPVVMLSMVWLI